MAKMTLFWMALYFGCLVLAVVHPIYPLISYLTFYYLPPHLNWWGDGLPDLRYSLLASAVLALAVLVRRGSLEPLKDERNPALAWFALFTFNTVLVTTWAVSRARSWEYSVAVAKLLVLYLLIPAAVRTPTLFDVFGTTHVAGAAYWGYKAWDNPKREGSRLLAVGGPDTYNTNEAAAHLLTVVPFVALYFLTSRRKVGRLSAAVAGAFVINTIVLCNSRGATIGLLGAGASAIVLAGRGRRLRLATAGICGALALLLLADPQFIDRQQTAANAEDGAVQGRLVAWRAGLRLVQDHPLGAGGRGFHELSGKYIPGIVEAHEGEQRSPHNTFIQLPTDWGIQGTLLFFGFLGSTFRLLRHVRRRAASSSWYAYRALAVETALIGTLIAGVFSSRLYGESIYWMCALAFALHRIQTTELAGADIPAPATGAPAAGSLPRRAQGSPADPTVHTT